MAIYKLGDILKSPPTYGASQKALLKGKYKYFRQTNIFNRDDIKFVNNHENKFMYKGDLLISRAGANAGTPYLHEGEDTFVYAGYLVKYEIDSEKALTKFIYYSILLSKDKIRNLITGAAQPNFNPPTAKNLILDIPSITEQQKIIDIIEPLEQLISNIEKQKNSIKNIAKNNYINNTNSEKPLISEVVLMNNKYDGQTKYFATNGIGEFSRDLSKVLNIKENRPSRANVSPEENSFIFSKLLGENKFYYFVDKPQEVYSTGFFNIKAESPDHLFGFFLTNHWTEQKKSFGTGTTMVGINNKSLFEIVIKKANNSCSDLVKAYGSIDLLQNKLEELKNKAINLLIK